MTSPLIHEDMIPPTGFIRFYVDTYLAALTDKRVTDAPDSFHVAMAYGMLGFALLDRMRFEWAGKDLFTNISILLMADSGIWRKTTAIELGAKRLRNDAELSEYIGADESSAEGLIRDVQQKRRQLLIYPEMINTFSIAATWGGRLLPTIMAMMDCPDDYRVSLSKPVKRAKDAPEPECGPIRLSVCGAINMAALNNIREAEVCWHNGFFGRFLLVAPADRYGNLYPDIRDKSMMQTEPQQVSATAINMLQRHLSWLRNLPEGGRVILGLSPEAYEIFSTWQDSIAARVAKLPSSFSRFPIHAVKLAMINNADLHHDEATPYIQADSMLYATRFCNMVLASVEKQLGLFTPDRNGQEICKVLSIIRRGGNEGISQSVLLRTTRIQVDKLEGVLKTLIASAEIVKDTRKTGKRGRPAVVYCAIGDNAEHQTTLNSSSDHVPNLGIDEANGEVNW